MSVTIPLTTFGRPRRDAYRTHKAWTARLSLRRGATRQAGLLSAARENPAFTVRAADEPVGSAAELFLDSLHYPNTLRAYGTGVGKTADRLGEQRALATVVDDEFGEALELL